MQSENHNMDRLPGSVSTPDKIHGQISEAFKAELARMQEADSPERAELYKKAARLGIAIISGEVK